MPRDGEVAGCSTISALLQEPGTGHGVAMNTHTSRAASSWRGEWHPQHCWEEPGRKGPEPASG